MIVRISGTGQYELDDQGVRKLDELDTTLTQALEQNDTRLFHEALHAVVAYVTEQGVKVSDDRVVPSEVIIPPDDVTLEEAQRFFTDDGLMAPLPA